MPTKTDLEEILTGEHPEVMLESIEPFSRLMMRYKCAIMEVETKLRVLNAEFSVQYDRNPFESIKSRLKSPLSILEKLRRRDLPVTLEGMEQLFDIAGVRVICSFQEDIYALVDMLLAQDDIRLIEKKDYIQHPKPNGYRSLHLIVEVPIFLSQEKRYMKVEVQFRTIAMDFWASLEHKLKYKKDVKDPELIAARLRACAEQSALLDLEMQKIRHLIEWGQE